MTRGTPPSNVYVGHWIGDFQIDRPVGQGAFAWVYHGESVSGVEVAVKILHSSKPSAALRFAREIKVLAALPPDPHLPAFHGSGTTRLGAPYLVIDYIPGITLNRVLAKKKVLPVRSAVSFCAQLAHALSSLHGLGVAHRDLKPENILLRRDGHIKLIDFGLVRDAQGMLKLFEEEDILAGSDFADDIDVGMLAGTPEYMAPEQFQDCLARRQANSRTDTWSDVFSVGVILYQLITGQLLFPMRRVQDEQYASELHRYVSWRLSLPEGCIPGPEVTDGALWSVLSKALRFDPARRQRDARELAGDLDRYVESGAGITPVEPPGTTAIDLTEYRQWLEAVERERPPEPEDELAKEVMPWPPPPPIVGGEPRPSPVEAASEPVENLADPPLRGEPVPERVPADMESLVGILLDEEGRASGDDTDPGLRDDGETWRR